MYKEWFCNKGRPFIYFKPMCRKNINNQSKKEQNRTKEENLLPVVVFQLTTTCGSSDNASIQHSICKKHSLCDGLHQLLYSANVSCSVLVYHACSSDIHMSSKGHWISDAQSFPWKQNNGCTYTYNSTIGTIKNRVSCVHLLLLK